MGVSTVSFLAALLAAAPEYSLASLPACYSAAARRFLPTPRAIRAKSLELGACAVKTMGMLARHFTMYL